MTMGGRYAHIMGANDKGRAVEILTTLFKKQFGKIVTVGLGDSENDFSMLAKVDMPFLVAKNNRRYSSPLYRKAGGIGPEGWNKILLKIIR